MSKDEIVTRDSCRTRCAQRGLRCDRQAHSLGPVAECRHPHGMMKSVLGYRPAAAASTSVLPAKLEKRILAAQRSAV